MIGKGGMMSRSPTINTQNVRIMQMLDLAVHQRQSLIELRHLVAAEAAAATTTHKVESRDKIKQPARKKPSAAASTLVGCCVRSGVQASSPSASVFGVNFQFYRRRNDGNVLRGLLKGCAEQNALGSYAAQGHRFADIAEIFLFGQQLCLHPQRASSSPAIIKDTKGNEEEEEERGGGGGGGRGSCAGQCCTIVPCRECWSHLCAVSNQVAEARQGERPTLFIASNGIAGIDAAVAQITRLQEAAAAAAGGSAVGQMNVISSGGPSVVIVPCSLAAGPSDDKWVSGDAVSPSNVRHASSTHTPFL